MSPPPPPPQTTTAAVAPNAAAPAAQSPLRRHARADKDSNRFVNRSTMFRVARRACVTRVCPAILPRTRKVVELMAEEYVRLAVFMVRHARKKTITEADMLRVAKMTGNAVYFTDMRSHA